MASKHVSLDDRHWVRTSSGWAYAGRVFSLDADGEDDPAHMSENNYSMRKTSSEANVTYQRYNPEGLDPPWSSTLRDPPIWDGAASWDANDEIKLIEKLGREYRGSDFAFGVSAGEAKESLSMITNAATRIAGASRAARKLDVKGMFKSFGFERKVSTNVKAVSDLRMEYRYGVRPFLSDIDNAAKALAEITSQAQVRRVIRASLRKKGPFVATNSNGSLVDGEFTVGRMYRVFITRDANALQRLGFTPLNALSVAWELTTLSWMADWFLDVGSYLSALDSAFLLNMNSDLVVRSDFRVARGVWRPCDRVDQSECPLFEYSGRQSRSNVVENSRERVHTIIVPPPQMKLSEALTRREQRTGNTGFLWDRALDALAVASGAVLGLQQRARADARATSKRPSSRSPGVSFRS